MSMANFDRRVFALGVIAFGFLGLIWGDFLSGQPVPENFPNRTAFAYAAAVFMLIAGTAIVWRGRAAAWGSAALLVYYGLVVLILMNGRVILKHYTEFGAYNGASYPLAIAAGALIVFANNATVPEDFAARLAHLGQVAFGLCALVYGASHFIYLNFTVPLVPKWLPPSQEFCAFATGIGHISAGIAILIGAQARLAALLLAAMFASFIPLVFVPVLMADPSSHFRWTEAATTIVLTGVAWLVANSLVQSRR
jgi:uncharacterized membrane protein